MRIGNLPDGLLPPDLIVAYQAAGGSCDISKTPDEFLFMGGMAPLTLDRIAEELKKFGHGYFDFSWFNEQVAEHKKLAGLQNSDPAEYDVLNCSAPLIERIYASKYGGTIVLRKEAEEDVDSSPDNEIFIGPTGSERNKALETIKKHLLKMPSEEVTFSGDARNPHYIHFRWDSPYPSIIDDRAEYLSVKEILKFLNENITHDMLDVSADIRAMEQQVAGRFV